MHGTVSQPIDCLLVSQPIDCLLADPSGSELGLESHHILVTPCQYGKTLLTGHTLAVFNWSVLVLPTASGLIQIYDPCYGIN
jgi:hypothetical protein